jgi:hypothetical protein
MSALGRRAPSDWKHLERYQLTALPKAEQPTGVPVAIGVNWYEDFDVPEWADGRWWVAGRGISRGIRGGHCVCLKSVQHDPTAWWDFYNQGREGACVGFGCSRMMSELNRVRYDATWLWQRARLTDEWSDNDDLSNEDEGTSVRAALAILQSEGHKRARMHAETDMRDGISAYRWTTSADEVMNALGITGNAVPFLNSWGRDYPHTVWMTADVLQRLLNEDGEAAIITDR